MSYYPSYTSGDFKALCMRCGRLFKGSQLQQTWDGLWVCKEDWEPKHTQLLVMGVKDDQRPPFVFRSLPVYGDNQYYVEAYTDNSESGQYWSSDGRSFVLNWSYTDDSYATVNGGT